MNTALTSTGSYAQRVRAELADLPADEVDELTEGLEADLAEAWAENNGLPTIDPVSYAEELRRAAGLPAPGEQRKPGLFARLNQRRERLVSSVSDSSVGAATVEFLASLQPAWWLARGYLAWALFYWTLGGIPSIVPMSVFSLLVFALFLIGSAWVGRQTETGVPSCARW